MADYYMSFSAEIADLTQKEYTWLLQMLELTTVDELPVETRYLFFEEAGTNPEEYGESYDWPPFAYKFCDEGTNLWFYAEQDFNVEVIGAFLHRFMFKHNREGYLYLTWSETCSKPRTDAFSGGALVASKKGYRIAVAHDLVDSLKKKLSKL